MSHNPQILYLLARRLILKKLIGKENPLPDLTPELQDVGASFVTLKNGGELRGCIGTLKPYRPLWEDIQNNGFYAAFNDNRFSPMTIDEYKDISVEISILSLPEKVIWRDLDELKKRIVPNKDGVVLSAKGRQATFLPQVWEQLQSFEEFFMHLGLKAGLGPNALELSPEISKYNIDCYKESDKDEL